MSRAESLSLEMQGYIIYGKMWNGGTQKQGKKSEIFIQKNSQLWALGGQPLRKFSEWLRRCFSVLPFQSGPSVTFTIVISVLGATLSIVIGAMVFFSGFHRLYLPPLANLQTETKDHVARKRSNDVGEFQVAFVELPVTSVPSP